MMDDDEIKRIGELKRTGSQYDSEDIVYIQSIQSGTSRSRWEERFHTTKNCGGGHPRGSWVAKKFGTIPFDYDPCPVCTSQE